MEDPNFPNGIQFQNSYHIRDRALRIDYNLRYVCTYVHTYIYCEQMYGMQQEDARIAFKANLELRTRGQYYLLKCILYVNCINCSGHSAENTLWWRLANKLSYNCQCYCIITYTLYIGIIAVCYISQTLIPRINFT